MEIELCQLPKQTHPPLPLHLNHEETTTPDKLIQELLTKTQFQHLLKRVILLA